MNWIILEKWLKYILGALLIFIAPIKPLLLIVGFMIIVDTTFGIIRSRKLGIKFTSRRFFAFFKKSFVYQVLVITTYILDHNLINEFTTSVISIELLTTKLMAAAICYNEFKSVDENVKIAYGIDITQYIKSLFQFAKKTKDGLDELR
jgi:hypothetical protein